MALLFAKLLPIILIILIGMVLQKMKDITPDVISGFKFIIVNIGLPSVLFFAFLEIELESKYLFLFIAVFFLCLALYGVGLLLKRQLKYKFTPGFFTGFEFGMVGIALFTAIWGIEKLPVFTLIALGHEVFVWFVYVPLLEYTNTQEVDLKNTLKSFVSSPIIIGIALGIILNVTGLFEMTSQTAIGQGIFNTLNTLSLLTVPLILLVIGHSLAFDHINWSKSFYYVALRLAATLGLRSIAYFAIINVVGPIDDLFAKAFYGFILLPPSYIFPLFIENNEEELRFFTNISVIYTLVSFVAFVILMLI